ncbi:MAG: TraR/DksA C4-type zinc finger protein [bacterium]|nr:TraR/DksA C4-type zinc finger protein [bacterium]
MPTPSKLNKKELTKFKVLIENELDEIRKNLRKTEENIKKSPRDDAGDLSAYSIHLADQGTDTNETEKLLLFREKTEKYFYKLEESLNKIKSGTFGICAGCGKPISKERLKAVLCASYCLKCKQERQNSLE